MKRIKKILILILSFGVLISCSEENEISNDFTGNNLIQENLSDLIKSVPDNFIINGIEVNTENKFWEITEDFSLEENLILPPNITLYFNGGSLNIKNYTLTLNGSTISGKEYQYFLLGNNGDINGSCTNSFKPEWFGAIGNGESDDTEALNKMFRISQNNFDLNGTYFISKSGVGSDQRDVAIEIKNKKNINIYCKGKLVFDRSKLVIPNLFLFTECENVNIYNLKAHQLKKEERSQINVIYSGSMIKLHKSKNVSITGGEAINTSYHTIINNSENVTIDGARAINEYTHIEGTKNEGASAFLLYNARSSIVTNCTVTGSYWDGTISLFGGATKSCIISNNIINGFSPNDSINPTYMDYKVQQGITIDQGPQNCLITANHIEGFYYGIDIKANQQHTSVKGNTIKSCKVGIAERRGEAIHTSTSIEGQVSNNTIHINKQILNATNTKRSSSGFSLYGYFSEKRLSGNVNNNLVIIDINSTPFASTDKPIAGMTFRERKDQIEEFKPHFKIQNNNVVFELGFNSNYKAAPKGSVAYEFINMDRFTFDGNSYTMPITEVRAGYSIKLKGDIEKAVFTNNQGKDTKTNKRIDFSELNSQSDIIWSNNAMAPFSLDCYTKISETKRKITYSGVLKRLTSDINNKLIKITTHPKKINYVLNIKATALSTSYGNRYTSAEIIVEVDRFGAISKISKNEVFENKGLSFYVTKDASDNDDSVYLTIKPIGNMTSLNLDLEINSSLPFVHTDANKNYSLEGETLKL